MTAVAVLATVVHGVFALRLATWLWTSDVNGEAKRFVATVLALTVLAVAGVWTVASRRREDAFGLAASAVTAGIGVVVCMLLAALTS